MFLQSFAKVISILLTVVLTVFSPSNAVFGKYTEKIAHKNENCRLSFAVISDTHLDKSTSVISDGMLELGLNDMENAEDRLDAVVFDGDITNHGYTEQWDMFASSIKAHDISDNLFLVTGNHDTWGPNRDDFTNPVDGVLTTFIKYNKEVAGRDIENMYYSDIVNGYYFIALGSEADNTSAYISDAQLNRFSVEMEKASKTGLPVFVFCHHPINGTHGLPYTWELDKNDTPDRGGLGNQSDDVLNILKKYDNVFYITGHIHAGFKNADDKLGADYASVEYITNDNGNDITLINVPSFTNPDLLRTSHLVNGCGYLLEVYDNEVLIRARNFAAGTYITKYDVTVQIVK